MPSRAGMTLVELVVAMPLILAAALMLMSTVAATNRQRTITRENALVAEVVRSTLERMRNEDFRDVYALYNADPDDDPDWPGSAPGHRFFVPGLDARPDSPDGRHGEIQLPALENWVGDDLRLELREDLEAPVLGLPRDLNGDNEIDGEDHARDYAILPVRVVVEWQSAYGPRQLSMFSMLVEMDR